MFGSGESGRPPEKHSEEAGDEQTAEMATFRNCYKGLAADGSALDEGDIAENVSINFSGQNAQRGGKFGRWAKTEGFLLSNNSKKKRTPNVAATHTTILSKLVCLLPFNFASNSLQFCRKKKKKKTQD